MIFRVISAICGVAIIVMAINTKNDKTGKHSEPLRDKYTDESIAIYIKGSVYAEIFFGVGLLVSNFFAIGIGFYIGTFISLLGIILLFVFMKKLVKKNVPYRNDKKHN